jgi:PKD repeat protein
MGEASGPAIARASPSGKPPAPPLFGRRRAPAMGVLRALVLVVLGAMLALSVYGTLVPAAPRCHLPGAVGCPGGLLGPAVLPAGSGNQWFDVTMYDWGFWVVDSTSGSNVSGAWNVFEGWTIHVNATSLPADAAIGGTAYHGLGIEVNATGQQLMSLAAPVGQWVSASFVAPTSAYYHQHIWCTIQCGPGHGSQQEYILNIIPAVPLPIATASANATLGPAPFAVSLSGSASSGTAPYNLTWSFGDGSPNAYGASASHTYALGGIYYATLTVTDAKANQGRATVTITVLSNAPLTATLVASPAGGLAPFGTSLSTVAHGGTPPYRYAWNFGDGTSGPGPNATNHVYTAPGIYATSVDITDSAGTQLRAITSIMVHPSSGTLTVRGNSTPVNGTTPLQTTLAASASGGTAPYAYTWILGDGTTGSGASVPHLYNQTGSYEAVVFAADAVGNGGFATVNVVVTAPVTGGGGGGGDGGNDSVPTGSSGIAAAASALTVRLLTSPAGGAPPLTVNTIASVQNGTGLGETVSWSFGDGGSGTGQVTSHVFSTTGTYTVTATVTDSGGNTGSASTTVTVGGASLAIVVNRTVGDSPFAVAAGATLTGGSGNWGAVNWTFGDGGSATGYLVSHAYGANVSGTFTISAVATDSAGAKVNASVVVTLTGPPTARLAVTLPVVHGLPAVVSLAVTVTGGSGGYASQVLWTFGDLTSTRGPPLETHPYNRSGHFLVTVETNDSSGRVALASAWVNISSALALPHLGGGQTVWVFTGVPNPETAALVMMGLVGATGLGFLVRKGRKRRAATQRSAGPSTPSRGRPASGAAQGPHPPE